MERFPATGRRRCRAALLLLLAPLLFMAPAHAAALLEYNFDRLLADNGEFADNSALRSAASQGDPALPGDAGTCGYGEFRGKDHYIDFGTPELGLSDAMTVMVWMRWDIDPATGKRWSNVASWNSEFRGDKGVFWLQHGRNNDRVEFSVATDKGRRYAQSRNIAPLRAGEWRHVAGVYDGSALIIYVDGVEAGRRSHTGRLVAPKPEDKLQLGRWAKMWGDHRAFEGGIDEFKLYDRALSAEEIAAAMQARHSCPSLAEAIAAPPMPEAISHWPMDERIWNGFPDQVVAEGSQPLSGTPMGGVNIRMDEPALAEDERGGSCGYGQFDGHAEYVDVGTEALDLGEQLTVAAWVRWDIDPASGNKWSNIISNNSYQRGNRGQFWLQHNWNNSRAEFAVATTQRRLSVFSSTRFEKGRWYHVAGTYDGARLKLYVDGVLEHFRYLTGNVVPADPAYQTTIGRWAYHSQNHRAFAGDIDEVALLGEALTPRQIRQLMQSRRDCEGATPAFAPSLTLNSHSDGEAVPPADVLLRGHSADEDGRVDRLSVTIEDPLLGRSLAQDVPVDGDGNWQLLVPRDAISPGETLAVKLRAEDNDSPANATELNISLPVVAETAAGWQFDQRQWWTGETDEIGSDAGVGALTALGGVHTTQDSPASGSETGTCSYVQFAGNDDGLDGGNLDLGLSDQLTVSAWARWDIDPVTGNNWSVLVSNNSDKRVNDGQFWLQHSWNNKLFEFAVRTDAGRRYVFSRTKPKRGVWYHVAGVFDGEKLRIYVNGEEERTRSHKGNFVLKPEYRFTVGRWAHQRNNYRAFRGGIDEVQLFADALGPAEIALMAAQSRACDTTPDTAAPQLQISSPSAGEQLPENGFVLSGMVRDNIGVERLTLSLSDASLGSTIDTREVRLSPAGNWQVNVLPEQYTPGGSVDVTLRATDPAGNVGTLEQGFAAHRDSRLERALLNRLTFGATPELIEQVNQLGLDGFLEWQLDPANIDDSLLEARLNGVEVTRLRELQQYQMLHMLYSKRQLREVMAWFWENHFNTYGYKPHNHASYEFAEHKAFRENALGNFRTLLGISAKSPAMLVYLDSVSNHKDDANENYARELLELHTLGVDGGYTAADVRAAAEIFTGWRVRSSAFWFDERRHTPGDKTVLGVTIPGGGVDEGEQLLDVAAAHPATAEFICTKLVTMLVADDAPGQLVTACAERFQETLDAPDQIAQLLRLIVHSAEFAEEANFNAKVKTPLELMTGLLRQFEGESDGIDLLYYLRPLGMGMFENPVPTGWPEEASEWISPGGLQVRIFSTSKLARRQTLPQYSHIQPLPLFAARGLDSAEKASRWLLDLMLGDRYSSAEWQIVMDTLGEDFNLDLADAETRLRRAIFMIASYPRYQLQ